MAEKNSLRDLFGKGKDLYGKAKDKAFGAVDRAADAVSDKYDMYQFRKTHDFGGTPELPGYEGQLDTPYLDALHSGHYSFAPAAPQTPDYMGDFGGVPSEMGGGADMPDPYVGDFSGPDQFGVIARARRAAEHAYRSTLEAAGRGMGQAGQYMPDMPDLNMPFDPRTLYNQGRRAVGMSGTVANPDYRLPPTPQPGSYPFQGGYMPEQRQGPLYLPNPEDL